MPNYGWMVWNNFIVKLRNVYRLYRMDKGGTDPLGFVGNYNASVDLVLLFAGEDQYVSSSSHFIYKLLISDNAESGFDDQCAQWSSDRRLLRLNMFLQAKPTRHHFRK